LSASATRRLIDLPSGSAVVSQVRPHYRLAQTAHPPVLLNTGNRRESLSCAMWSVASAALWYRKIALLSGMIAEARPPVNGYRHHFECANSASHRSMLSIAL
jgi:hypothetical protein